jgi:N-acylneuraminate cytidylyltransferase
MNWTAFIPVRGGSKGLVKKNIRLLAGKPLYFHAIDVALAAGASRIIISTDISEILTANLPPTVEVISRPVELCDDSVPMAPVFLHGLQKAKVSGPVVLLQATSPLRDVSDVQAALKLLMDGGFDLVIAVTEAERSILKWGMLQGSQFLPLARTEYCFSNRQDLPQVYKPNGAVCAMQAEWFLRNKSFVSEHIGSIVMPIERSHDIDNLEDFERCEELMSKNNNSGVL